MNWSQSGGFGFDAGVAAGVAGFSGSLGIGYHGGQWGWNAGAELLYMQSNISAYGQSVGYSWGVDWYGLNKAYERKDSNLPPWLRRAIDVGRGWTSSLPGVGAAQNYLAGPLLGSYDFSTASTSRERFRGRM